MQKKLQHSILDKLFLNIYLSSWSLCEYKKIITVKIEFFIDSILFTNSIITMLTARQNVIIPKDVPRAYLSFLIL